MTSDLTRLKHPYRPDIDGLRALAVIAVLLAHADVVGFQGGFVGVDIFFCISGYVVTNAIDRDITGNRFSFLTFYARRAKRLIPALLPVLAFTFAFCLLLTLPSDMVRLAKGMLAVVTSTSNIFLAKQSGYFAPDAASLPLLHTWSLSVEEQFYVFLPLLLFLTRRWPHAWRITLIVLSTLTSFGVAVLLWQADSIASYYNSGARAFEFLIGVAIAMHASRDAGERLTSPSRHVFNEFATLTGLGVIGVGIYASRAEMFPGYGALLPCFGSMLVIAFGAQSILASRLLSNRVMVALGTRSYAIYLWHWPALYACRTLGYDGTVDRLVTLLIACLLAFASYRFIERPIRDNPSSSARSLRNLVCLPILIAGIMAGVGRLTGGFRFAYPVAVQTNLRWSGDALFDMPRGQRCWNKIDVSDASTCYLGNRDATSKAVLWGDSHAYHLVHFFDALGLEKNVHIHDVGFTLCPPVGAPPLRPGPGRGLTEHAECVRHSHKVMEFITTRKDIDTVILAAAWQNYRNTSVHPEPNGHGFLPNRFEADLERTITALRKHGKRVVLMDDIPTIPKQMINCQIKNALWIVPDRQICEFDEIYASDQHRPVAAMLDRLARIDGVSVMHTYDLTCSAGKCALDFDGVPIYQFDDYHHLSAAGSRFLYKKYVAARSEELARLFAARSAHDMRSVPTKGKPP